MATGQESNLSNTRWLVETARLVLIKGIDVALDEAGTRVVGPTGWRVFKQVLTPVVERLQQRFPALAFGRPEDKRAVDAVSNAAEYLAQSAKLQKLLVANFESLAEGQKEILVAIHRLEIGQESISETVQKIWQEIQRERQATTPSGELSTWIDLSDYQKDIEAQHPDSWPRGREVATLSLNYAFNSIVADEGRTYKVYKSRIPTVASGPVATAYSISGKYRDQNGKLCRKMVIDANELFPQEGEILDRSTLRLTTRFCQAADGTWLQGP